MFIIRMYFMPSPWLNLLPFTFIMESELAANSRHPKKEGLQLARVRREPLQPIEGSTATPGCARQGTRTKGWSMEEASDNVGAEGILHLVHLLLELFHLRLKLLHLLAPLAALIGPLLLQLTRLLLSLFGLGPRVRRVVLKVTALGVELLAELFAFLPQGVGVGSEFAGLGGQRLVSDQVREPGLRRFAARL